MYQLDHYTKNELKAACLKLIIQKAFWSIQCAFKCQRCLAAGTRLMGHFQETTDVGKNAIRVKMEVASKTLTSSSERRRDLAISHVSKHLMPSKCFVRYFLPYGINCDAKGLWLFSPFLVQN